MAQFLTDTQINSVYELYIGYFNRAPEAGGLNYWSNYYLGQVNAGKTDAAIQKDIANQFYSAAVQYNIYSAGTPVEDFIKASYLNALGRDSVDDAGMTYWTAKLSSGEVTRGEFVQKLISDAKGFASDATYGWVSKYLDNRMAVAKAFAAANTTTGEAAITAGKSALNVVTPALVQAGQTVEQAVQAAKDNGVGSATLTGGTDILSSSQIYAPQVYTPGGNDRINSLQDEDQLTGVSGNDVLKATLGNANDNGATIITPKLNGIETVQVAFTGSGNAVVALDLQDATGVKQIDIERVTQASDHARIENIKQVVETLSIANTNANNVGTVEFSFGVDTLKGDNSGKLNLSNVQIGTVNIGQNVPGTADGLNVTGQSYETLTLNSASAANKVGTLNLPMDTGTNGKVVITGDKALNISGQVQITGAAGVEATAHNGGIFGASGRLASIDASGLTGGGLTLNINNGLLSTGKADTSGVAQNVTITGSAQDDTFYLNDTVQAGDSINGGDGKDTLVVYTGNVAGTVSKVETVSVQLQNASVALDFDKLADTTLVSVRNITNNANVAGDNGADQTATLTNLTVAQAAALNIEHSTSGNNGIADTTLNIGLKNATGTSDTAVIAIKEGVNVDPRFNFTVTANGIENLTFADADSESNSIALTNLAALTGTLKIGTDDGKGIAGTFINFDTALHTLPTQAGGYRLDVDGNENDYAATDTALAATGLTANARYRTLDNGATGDIRITALNVDGSAEASDIIVRLGDVTRTDGVSSQSITGGSGNDTFIFDAQGVRNSGYTSGDTVKGGAGLDTLVIDGHTTAAQANGAAGVTGNISVQKSEWDNTSGIDVLRLAGNQGYTNVGSNKILSSSTTTNGYYIEIDNEFVKQTDAGNNLKIISNDGNLDTSLESDLLLNLRSLSQTSNVTFVGANGNAASAATNASNRLQVEDNSANGANDLDGGDTLVTETISTGNNNVLEVFNTADVSINDLAKTKNFGRIEGTNDLATSQTLKLVLNDTVVDQLVDAGTAASTTNVERLVVVAKNNTNVAGAVENLNIDASLVSNKFALDVIVDRGTTNTIVGTAGTTDKVVLKGNFTADEQAADGHAVVTLFAGANALTGAALTTAIAANGTAYKGVDGVAGTADDVLLAYTGTYTNIETIEIFGGVDLTGATISAGNTIVAHSAVRLTAEQFNALGSITFVGGGAHGLQIVNNTTTTPEVAPNLSKVTVSGAGTTVNYFTGTEVPAATGTATLSSGATTAPTNGGTTTGTTPTTPTTPTGTQAATTVDGLGTDATPAALDANASTTVGGVATTAYNFTDNVATRGNVRITNFGADDIITISGGTSAAATQALYDANISSSGADVQISYNNGGQLNLITLVGVNAGGAFVNDVASFNALSVGNLVFA